MAFDGTAAQPPVRPRRRAPGRGGAQLVYYGVYVARAASRVALSERRRRRRDALALVQARPAHDRDRDAGRPRRRRRRSTRTSCAARDVQVASRWPGTDRRRSRRGRPRELAAQRHRDRRPGAAPRRRPSFSSTTRSGSPASRRSLIVRVAGRETLSAGSTLTRAARVTATVETPPGASSRRSPSAALPAGRFAALALERPRGGKFLAYGGVYRVRFRATNELGAVELFTHAFRVIRAAPVPTKKPKPLRANLARAGRLDPSRDHRSRSRRSSATTASTPSSR